MPPRYITNDTASPMYVAGRLIPPFDGRHFEDHELPPEHKPAAAAAAPEEPSLDEELKKLLAGTIKEISPQLEALTFEALDRLAMLEMQVNADAPRKGLLQAVDAEKLRRADEQLQKDQAEQAAKALEEARQALLQARVARLNQPPTATEAEIAAADAAVQEAEARVQALSPEGE